MKNEKTYIPPAGSHRLTPFYDLLTSLMGFGKRYKRRVLNSVPLAGHETLLDVGCGTGVLLELAKTNYPRIKVIGIDPDLPALSIAQNRFERAGLQAELKQAFAESLPLPDDLVDVCFSTLAFHHMANDIKETACAEIFRVLKKGGRVLLSDFYAPKILIRGMIRGTLVSKEVLPTYLERTGFRNVRVLWAKVPFVQTIVAEK